MTYNLHPLFVHFPIALLFLYSLVKIVPLKRLFPSISWIHVERFLLLFGVLGAFAALATGETAEHLTRANRSIVEMHSLFAGVSTTAYSLLLVSEALSLALPRLLARFGSARAVRALSVLERFLSKRAVSVAVAVAGLVAISVTGLLGGVMVYGTTADPFAAVILKLLGISL